MTDPVSHEFEATLVEVGQTDDGMVYEYTLTRGDDTLRILAPRAITTAFAPFLYGTVRVVVTPVRKDEE